MKDLNVATKFIQMFVELESEKINGISLFEFLLPFLNFNVLEQFYEFPIPPFLFREELKYKVYTWLHLFYTNLTYEDNEPSDVLLPYLIKSHRSFEYKITNFESLYSGVSVASSEAENLEHIKTFSALIQDKISEFKVGMANDPSNPILIADLFEFLIAKRIRLQMNAPTDFIKSYLSEAGTSLNAVLFLLLYNFYNANISLSHPSQSEYIEYQNECSLMLYLCYNWMLQKFPLVQLNNYSFFWRNAVYKSLLVKKLSAEIPKEPDEDLSLMDSVKIETKIEVRSIVESFPFVPSYYAYISQILSKKRDFLRFLCRIQADIKKDNDPLILLGSLFNEYRNNPGYRDLLRITSLRYPALFTEKYSDPPSPEFPDLKIPKDLKLDFNQFFTKYLSKLEASVDSMHNEEGRLLATLNKALKRVVATFLPDYHPPTEVTSDQEPKLFESPAF
jgi:hypothetical protein